MVKLVNRAKVSALTTGTGTLTLGPSVDGFQSFAASGVTNGDTVRYVIEDGDAWEIGVGTFNAAAQTLTRSPSQSSSGGSAISLGGSAVVYVTATAEDFAQNYDGGAAASVFLPIQHIDGGNA
jgi:hypothetical protein